MSVVRLRPKAPCAVVAQLVERHLAKVEVASPSLVYRSIFIWCHSQVVRQRSAKPSFPGSNPGGTSKEQGDPLPGRPVPRKGTWKRIEVVVTSRTRNAVVREGTWVRIPPLPPPKDTDVDTMSVFFLFAVSSVEDANIG